MIYMIVVSIIYIYTHKEERGVKQYRVALVPVSHRRRTMFRAAIRRRVRLDLSIDIFFGRFFLRFDSIALTFNQAGFGTRSLRPGT